MYTVSEILCQFLTNRLYVHERISIHMSHYNYPNGKKRKSKIMVFNQDNEVCGILLHYGYQLT